MGKDAEFPCGEDAHVKEDDGNLDAEQGRLVGSLEGKGDLTLLSRQSSGDILRLVSCSAEVGCSSLTLEKRAA